MYLDASSSRRLHRYLNQYKPAVAAQHEADAIWTWTERQLKDVKFHAQTCNFETSLYFETSL